MKGPDSIWIMPIAYNGKGPDSVWIMSVSETKLRRTKGCKF